MSIDSVLNFVTPFLIWAGKFVFIASVTFWAGSGWMFAYLIGYSPEMQNSITMSSLLIRKGRRFIRSFGVLSSVISILLLVEVYRQSSFSLYYLSFTVTAIITVISYLVIAEAFLMPALVRYEHLNTYVAKKNINGITIHSYALGSSIRKFCFYQLIPALFVILVVSFQFSVY